MSPYTLEQPEPPAEVPRLRASVPPAPTVAAVVPVKPAADFLIWSNEHEAWWGPGRCGYVGSFREAGRYTAEEAVTICADAIPGGAARFGKLPELPVLLSHVEAMQDAYRAAYPAMELECWE